MKVCGKAGGHPQNVSGNAYRDTTSELQTKSLSLSMPTFNIEILNPKAKKLLMDLAELRLISISENISNPFLEAVKRIRSKKSQLTQDEISREVESVRSRRYGK